MTQTDSDVDEGVRARAGGGNRERWGRFELTGLVVLLALTARVALSVVSGIAWARYSYPIDQASRFNLGNTIQYASGFGDVEGILILIGLTGFLWWALNRQAHEYQRAFEYDDWSDRVDHAVANVGRLAWMIEWLKLLYVVYLVGSVGLAISYALQVPTGQWLERIGAVGFVLTYIAIGICGMLVSFELGHQVHEFFASDPDEEEVAVDVDDALH